MIYQFKKLALCGMLGAIVSLFLLHEHFDDSAPFCDFNDLFSCSTVNKSVYSVFLGVPVAILGFSWNCVLIIASLVASKLSDTSSSSSSSSSSTSSTSSSSNSPSSLTQSPSSKRSEHGCPELLRWYAAGILGWCCSGIAFVAYLIYAEYVLGSICLMCTAVHLLSVFELALALGVWRALPSPVDLQITAPRLLTHCQLWMLLFLVLFALPMGYFNFREAESELPAGSALVEAAQLEALCRCVTAHNFIMYGSSACSHCQHQKQLLDAGFSEIQFHECGQECVEKLGIKGYPTWISYDESGTKELARFVGILKPEELANVTGCPFASFSL